MKKTYLLSPILLLMVVLAGCTPKSEPEQIPTEPNSPSAAETMTPENETTTPDDEAMVPETEDDNTEGRIEINVAPSKPVEVIENKMPKPEVEPSTTIEFTPPPFEEKEVEIKIPVPTPQL